MSNDENQSASKEKARAALSNIRRMLKGEVSFPESEQAAADMIEAAVPVVAPPLEDPPFTGTQDEVIAGFEAAAQRNENDAEFWSARGLMELLGYGSWRNFEPVMDRAFIACNQSGHTINHHFMEVRKMVEIGSDAERATRDYQVTRYGAYLIAQNGDARKKQVAFAQTYFAVHTRRQEIQEEQQAQALEEQRRVALRDEISEHNKDLAGAAKDAGVVLPVDYAVFQNAGYKGLYDGLDVSGIRSAKGLSGDAKILDHMGSTELAANLFRATQAEEKLRREGIKGKANANAAHQEVGQKVRKAITDIGGTMPEKLAPAEDINKVRKRLRNSKPKKKIE